MEVFRRGEFSIIHRTTLVGSHVIKANDLHEYQR